ncbi:hypothetical protein VIGAN_06082500, partial [Vigna angularis var. angularis]
MLLTHRAHQLFSTSVCFFYQLQVEISVGKQSSAACFLLDQIPCSCPWFLATNAFSQAYLLDVGCPLLECWTLETLPGRANAAVLLLDRELLLDGRTLLERGSGWSVMFSLPVHL